MAKAKMRGALPCSIVIVLLAVGGCGFSLGEAELIDGVPAPSRRVRSADVTEDTPPGPEPPQDDEVVSEPIDGGSGSEASTVSLTAFVSSTTVTGNLGGVAGADALCNGLAKAAGLPGTYRAWISTTAVDAIDRMTANGPWRTRDGEIVAQTKAQLASGNLADDLDEDEKGQTPPAAEDRVWTATGPNGRYIGGAADCGGWASTSGSGRVGEAAEADARWTSLVDEACTEVNRVYCFQQ